jgi:glutathione S-transferase
MSLTLHFHPLSSYCHKVLIALYENGTPFTPHTVDLMNDESRAAFLRLWPIGRFPVLHDDVRGVTIPESSTIIEYLTQHYPGPVHLFPSDPDLSRQMRFHDRFFDLYLHTPMQKIVADKIRPAANKDPYGVSEAKTQIQTALALVEKHMDGKRWVMGEAFSMADCAAAPPLFYINEVMPFGGTHRNIARYFERLKERPSYGRVLTEAQPYMKLFPR